MPILILLRHGQSTYNLENKFTGEVDVDLSQLGEQEARFAGVLLEDYIIDIAFTSVLKRAINTLAIILKELGKDVPVIQTKALNERNYGDLQGFNKSETEKRYGEEQVLQWRRGYSTVPPNGESLQQTYERVVPYYQTTIQPNLEVNKNILIVAHGNSLRALMMHLDGYSETDISGITIATGIPRVYNYTEALQLVSAHYL